MIVALKNVNTEKCSKALALGFSGVFLVLFVNLIIFYLLPDPLQPQQAGQKFLAIRYNILFDGLWSSVFCGYSCYALHVRPCKVLNSGWGSGVAARIADYSTIGWRRTWNTIKSIRKLKNFGWFMLAFVIYSGI